MDKKYRIIRFWPSGKKRNMPFYNLSLTEAQAYCRRDNTHKLTKMGEIVWFDGYTDDDGVKGRKKINI
jgi:hypothetical protein